MASIEAPTGYHVPVWVEALATARLTGAILVVSEANFGGQMPVGFRLVAGGRRGVPDGPH